MLWSIDSCQNRVSASQYYLTVSRAQVSTHRDRVFFISYPLTSYWFSNDRGLKFNLLKCTGNKLCLGATLLKFGFETDLIIAEVAFDFSHHGHALVTFYVQFLCSGWSQFDRRVQAENLCSIWKFVYCELKVTEFCVTLLFFETVFFHKMYKMKYSCYQDCPVIHGWFVYWV